MRKNAQQLPNIVIPITETMIPVGGGRQLKVQEYKNVTVSAPGKLMLFGEHAVVYNRPCIVTAVDKRLKLTAEVITQEILEIHAPGVGVYSYVKHVTDLGSGEIPSGAQFIEKAVKNFRKKYFFPGGVTISTTSEFSSQFGFGSSSAATVCTIKALGELFDVRLSNKEIFDLSYKTVLGIQGKGSGFDIAAAVWGGTLYFVTGDKIIEPLEASELPLVIGYTGVKADTVTFINKVAQQLKKEKNRVEGLFDEIEKIVELARIRVDREDWGEVGRLMNKNQTILEELGVGSTELTNLISAARDAGAYGAKLSGAGGGDCMIAAVPEGKRAIIESDIKKAGGQILKVEPNAEGVKVD